MMELRPIHAALLAGRSASRRAMANPSTLSYPLFPTFYRCFSSTRPSLSEAEAAAPAPTPTPSMQEWSRQQQQRQQQQQQQQQPEQKQKPAWGSASSGLGATGSMASLLRPNNSTTLSPPPPPPTTPARSEDTLRSPWATPTSGVLRRRQANRSAFDTNTKTPGIMDELKDLGIMSPTNEDLLNLAAMNNEPASEIKYRLRPSVGRTVEIGHRVDLARGLGLLNLRVRVNKVSQDFSRQRYHERPGLKRKRLRRERWRARFKDGFKANCKRVQELARQGW